MRFEISEMAELSEHFAEQLHFLPMPPEPYRAQQDEPVLEATGKTLLLVAPSGGGKTAWVAESAIHTGRPLIYFDIGGLPDIRPLRLHCSENCSLSSAAR